MHSEVAHKARLFVTSSDEGKEVAEAVREHLFGENLEIQLWSDPGSFELSETTIVSLEQALDKSDFALIVLTPDDKLRARNEEEIAAVRDNIILELGLFVGSIGRHRTFMIRPTKTNMKLPSNLLGVTVAKYTETKDDGDIRYNVGAACSKVRRAIRKAPLSRVDTLLSSIVFPRSLLKQCLAEFREFLKNDTKTTRTFLCDAQVTGFDSNGNITYHLSCYNKGKDIRQHEGQILWFSEETHVTDRPFQAIVDSSSSSGYVIWEDKGYSIWHIRIARRDNCRICVAFFQRVGNDVYALEIHHELAADLDAATLRRIGRIVANRIEQVDWRV